MVLDFGSTLVILGPPSNFNYSDLNYNINEFTINVNMIFSFYFKIFNNSKF